MRLNCPFFGGTTNPERAEDCLTKIVARMDLLNLNDHERVKCDAFLLQRNANTWWESVKMQRDIDGINWNPF